MGAVPLRDPTPTPAAIRQRRWRQRAKAGVMVVTVEADDAGIDWLIRHPQTLNERDAGNPREVGAAIARAIEISSHLK